MKNVEMRYVFRWLFLFWKFNFLMECVVRGLLFNFSVFCVFWFIFIDVLYMCFICLFNIIMLVLFNRGVYRRNVLMSLSFFNNFWVVILDYFIFRWSEFIIVNGSRKFYVGELWWCFSFVRYLIFSIVWLDLMNFVIFLEFYIFFFCILWF